MDRIPINTVRFDCINAADFEQQDYVGWNYHVYADDYTNKFQWTIHSSLINTTVYLRGSDMNNTIDAFFIAIQVVPPTGKKASFLTAPEFSVSCFPNPVVNELKIFSDNSDSPITSIHLYDIQGNAIKTYYYEETFMETIDVADLPKGTYVAIINEEEFVKVVKN